MPPFRDLAGRRVGRWLVIARALNRGADVMWDCQCDCGVRKAVKSASLIAGTSASCGCANPIAKTVRGWCSIDGCDRPHYAHGLCDLHNSRFQRTGTTDARPITGQYVAIIASDGSREWEHRDIAERVLGRPLPPKAQIHHVDDNGRNNSTNNLVICQDHAYHKDLHRRRRIFRAGGNPHTDWWCSGCRKPKPISLFNVRKSGRQAGRPTCYCAPCAAERRAAWANQ